MSTSMDRYRYERALRLKLYGVAVILGWLLAAFLILGVPIIGAITATLGDGLALFILMAILWVFPIWGLSYLTSETVKIWSVVQEDKAKQKEREALEAQRVIQAYQLRNHDTY